MSIFRIESYTRVPIDMDISVAAIAMAWTRSFEEFGEEPNMILVGPEGYHYAEKAVCHLGGRMKLMNVIVSKDLAEYEWAVGCSYKPESFIGSKGA